MTWWSKSKPVLCCGNRKLYGEIGGNAKTIQTLVFVLSRWCFASIPSSTLLTEGGRHTRQSLYRTIVDFTLRTNIFIDRLVTLASNAFRIAQPGSLVFVYTRLSVCFPRTESRLIQSEGHLNDAEEFILTQIIASKDVHEISWPFDTKKMIRTRKSFRRIKHPEPPT